MKKIAKILVIIALIVMIAFVFAGCKTRVITNSTSETKTITIKEKDTTFIYQGATVNNGNSIDSVIAYLQAQFKQGLNGVATKVIYKDKDNKVALTFWLDKMGKLQADCTSKDSSYQAKLTNITERYEKLQHQTEVIEIKYIPTWAKILIGILSGAVLVALALLIWIFRQIKIEF